MNKFDIRKVQRLFLILIQFRFRLCSNPALWYTLSTVIRTRGP